MHLTTRTRRRALDAIVFDFDGVIADSERLHLRRYQDVLAPLGLQLSADGVLPAHISATTMSCVLRRYAREHD